MKKLAIILLLIILLTACENSDDKCGDNICDPIEIDKCPKDCEVDLDETVMEAPIDLWQDCGDNACNSGETLLTCPEDCKNTKQESKVEVIDETPKLFVNDKVIPFTGLNVYCQMGCPNYEDDNWLDHYKKYIDTVKQSGLTYLQMGSNIPSKDFGKMDNLLDYTAEQGVFIIFLLPTSNPTRDWSESNPGTLQEDYNCYFNNENCIIDNTVSFHNQDWWKVKDVIITEVVNRYKDHPALLAWDVRVGSTTENNYGPSYIPSVLDSTTAPATWCDYSDFAISRWHSWLEDKYNTDENLQNAWDDTSVTLETAEMPIPLENVEDNIDDLIEHANSAGDSRKQFYDWQTFRLEEKIADFNHFAELVDTLDSQHIILTGPAFAPGRAAISSARSGKTNAEEMYKSEFVDGLVLHPRVSCDDKRSSFNTNRFSFYDVITYANRHEKLTTWINEDTAEMNSQCGNQDSIWRLGSISSLIASLGGGSGWVIGPDREDIPAWSENEFKELQKVNAFYTAINLKSPKPNIAVLFDQKADNFDYRKPGKVGLDSKTLDRVSWLESLYNNGLDFDMITTEDIKDNPDILNNYKAILLLHLTRLDTEIAQELSDYRDNGNGLFIGGRTGVYDEFGNYDTTALEILLDVESVTDFTSQVSSWSITSEDSPLKGTLQGTFDNENLFYIPQFNLDDYSAIGHLDIDFIPTVGYKDKTVFWFPRLTSDEDLVSEFQTTLWKFFESGEEFEGLESFGNNYRYLFSPETTSIDVDGFDWFTMQPSNNNLEENTPMFLSIVETSNNPQIIAVNGANIADTAFEDNMFAVALYGASNEVTIAFDKGDWNIKDAYVNGGRINTKEEIDNFYIVKASAVYDKITVIIENE